ncbi:MAG: dihydroorotate dehydrogenase [candidate division Zixibacteria bacterium]|nr:dihydroorotate dehydrogenase [candidate division Zixibacteria bacterium]
MTQPNLKVKIAGIEFANPILTASGTFGYGEEFNEYIDLSRLGGIVTKSITRHERKGHPPPRTAETASGMLNAIGLANVGVDAYVKEKLQFLRGLGTRIVVNVAGFDLEEFVYVIDKLNGHDEIDLIELNISCPNIKGDGMEFSSNPDIAYKVVSRVRSICNFPLMPKLSPNVADIRPIAKACEEAGADAISLINTLYGMAIDPSTWKIKLTNVTGGLSGPAIKPVAIALTWKVYNTVKIPIVGIGGIMDYRDVVEFMLAGATAVQFGTANFVQPNCTIRAIDALTDYLRERNISDVNNLIGKAKKI